VFQIPSARTVSQTPSTPWGRENAISAARLGSPELQRLPEATTYGFSAHAHRAAAAAIRIHRALASCAPSAPPPSFSPAGNSTPARRSPARSAMATEQRGFYRIVSADFAVCRRVHPTTAYGWISLDGTSSQTFSNEYNQDTDLLPVNRLIFYLSVNQRSLSSDRQRTFAVRPPLCVVIIGSVMCEQPIWTVELWLWGIQLSARSISTLVFVVIVNRGGCE